MAIKWTRSSTGTWHCEHASIRKHSRGDWVIEFREDTLGMDLPSPEQHAATLRQAKRVVKQTVEMAMEHRALLATVYKRLSEGERAQAALQSILVHCRVTETDPASRIARIEEDAHRGLGAVDP